MMGCVYCAFNLINNKMYIGFTTRSLYDRKREHIIASTSQSDNSPFHLDLRKFGVINFEWQIIYQSKNIDLLKQVERDQIKLYKTTDEKFGYNTNEGGDGKIDGNGILVSCACCGTRYTVEPRRYNENIKRGYNFVCSDRCHRKMNSLQQRGFGNVNYKHGKYIKRSKYV